MDPVAARDVRETMALGLDVQRVVDGLAPDLRTICRSLVDGRIKEIVAGARISRSVLTEKLKEVRAAREEVGPRAQALWPSFVDGHSYPRSASSRGHGRPRYW